MYNNNKSVTRFKSFAALIKSQLIQINFNLQFELLLLKQYACRVSKVEQCVSFVFHSFDPASVPAPAPFAVYSGVTRPMTFPSNNGKISESWVNSSCTGACSSSHWLLKKYLFWGEKLDAFCGWKKKSAVRRRVCVGPTGNFPFCAKPLWTF